MNIEELQAAAQSAGERYRAAHAELVSSYIQLRAYDEALNNGAVASLTGGHARTFAPQLLEHFELEHPVFAPRFPHNIGGEVSAARDTLLAQFDPKGGNQ